MRFYLKKKKKKKNPSQKKGWWNGSGVDPEFKLQYCKKKKKRNVIQFPNLKYLVCQSSGLV
jgi:hypothetical protein